MVTNYRTLCFVCRTAFISYEPYTFTWDDSDYLARAVAANPAFWSGDAPGLGAAMIGPHAPIMALLGLPWGPLTLRSGPQLFHHTGRGNSVLGGTFSLSIAARGVKPFFLVLAAACVGASFGPNPLGEHAMSATSKLYSVHQSAT